MESAFLWASLALVVIVLWILLRDDWLFITRPLVRAEGEVIRHDKTFSDGDDAWRAVFAFTDEDGARREALDITLFQNPRPPIGTRITLNYPKGAADKARVQRLLLRGLLYAVMLFMAAALVGRLMGWLPPGSG
ncbi:MAG: hypothetical protein ACKVOJ_04875 [Sphingomonadaceae bacterium]